MSFIPLGFLAASGSVSGDFQSIQTVSLGSSASSISFTSIPSTFTSLQIRGICSTSSNAPVNINFNSDSTSSNYAYHRLVGDGSSASAAAGTSLPRILDLSGTSTYRYAFVIDIIDYGSTSKNTVSRALQGYDTNGGSPTGQVTFASNLWLNTAAVTRIDLAPTSGTFDSNTHVALYGLKG